MQRRRWFQFGIGPLLVLTTVVALVFSFFVRDAYQRRDSARAIRAAGGRVDLDPYKQRRLDRLRKWLFGEDAAGLVWSIYLVEANVGDEIIPHLRRFPEMQTLGLEKTHVTDDGLADLGPLPKLRELMLTAVPLTGTCAGYLATLPELYHLNLGGTNFGDDAMIELARSPKLRELLVDATYVTNEGVRHLAPLAQLKHLSMRGTDVTSAGVGYVAQFSKLEGIGLYHTTVDDSAVEVLKEMPTLKDVDLQMTEITDRALALLDGLPNLEHLDISVTMVSLAALQDFRSRHPKCKVESYGTPRDANFQRDPSRRQRAK